MFCNGCGAAVSGDAATCPRCGRDLAPPSAEPLVLVTVSDEPGDPAPGTSTVEHPQREPAPARPQLYDLADDEPELLTDGARTTATAQRRAVTDQLPYVESHEDGWRERISVGPTSAVGAVALVIAGVAVTTPLVAIGTNATAPTFAVGEWRIDDLGSNLTGAAIVAMVALAVGVVGAAFRQRWAAGLAGGAGLALTGWAALVWGMAERPISVAVDATRRPTTEAFDITITRDIGYAMVLVVAVLGVVTFAASVARAGNDGRGGLNPWIAALAAAASVVAAAGPLLPEGSAELSANWDPGGAADRPAVFLVGRLVQMGLLVYSSVFGFLLVRRYGLGLAVGGMTVVVWLAATALAQVGTNPIGPAVTNPGSDPAAIDLHSVTIVGVLAMVGLALVSVIAAFDQAAREAPR